MPRWRLGVALLLPEPAAGEVNGLRRALNDGALERMVPHITLVPPVNVRTDELGGAVDVLRASAQQFVPFAVELGPVESFLPETPTLKLGVNGEGRAQAIALRNAVFRAPLERALTFPFVPHVTIADEANDARSHAALAAMCDYRTTVTFDRVHLMREGENRRWYPIADAKFSTPRTTGRGGLAITLETTALVDPATATALAIESETTDLAVTARLDGRSVGAIAGERDGALLRLTALKVTEADRHLGIGLQLLRAFIDEARDLGIRVIENHTDSAEITGFLETHGLSGGKFLFV